MAGGESVAHGGHARLGLLALLGALLGGCVHGAREELLESRRAFVVPEPGDGSTRLATWPMNRETLARLGESR